MATDQGGVGRPNTDSSATVPFAGLQSADLMVDAVYQGHRIGNAGDDPLLVAESYQRSARSEYAAMYRDRDRERRQQEAKRRAEARESLALGHEESL